MPSCVVTGGTGNVGHALINLLLQRGLRVYVLCHPHSHRIPFLPRHPDCHIFQLGLDALTEAADRIGETCRFFFHLAWHASYGQKRENPFGQVFNIDATLHAVELASILQCEAFVGVGSQAQYGTTDAELSETTSMSPTTFYGQAKYCAELMSRTFCRQLGMRHVWARILSVYGPCDGPDTLVTYLMRCFLQSETAHVTPGEQIWDYLYAEDAARALLALAEEGHDGQAYCVASGNSMPLSQYIEIWRQDVTQGRADVRMDKAYPADGRRRLSADISRLTADTGFHPQTAFFDGMRQTLAWYREHPEALIR